MTAMTATRDPAGIQTHTPASKRLQTATATAAKLGIAGQPTCGTHPDQTWVDVITHAGNVARSCPLCVEDRRAERQERDNRRRQEIWEDRSPARYRHARPTHITVRLYAIGGLEGLSDDDLERLGITTTFEDLCASYGIPTPVDGEPAPDSLSWWTKSLLILGPVGTGKTYEAYGALHELLRHDDPRVSWHALTHTDLIATLRPHGQDHDPEALLRQYIEADYLLLDDLGMIKMSEYAEEQTYRLINGRYNAMAQTIFTTNLTSAELRGALGDRITSRLAEDCIRIVLDGPDRRRSPAAQSRSWEDAARAIDSTVDGEKPVRRLPKNAGQSDRTTLPIGRTTA